MELKDRIKAYALQNAIKFNGRANPGAVIGRLINEQEDLKDKLKELQPIILDTIKQISKIKVEDQIVMLQSLAPELLDEKPKERKKGLPELRNPTNVIMRFAPSPSGPLHIGHAYPLSLNSEFCRKYKGKMLIRLEDTNADNIYPPAYKLIEDDAKWLTKNNIARVIIQSERMEIYYRHAENLISLGHAYVCTCKAEQFRELAIKMIPCPCRELGVKEHAKRWKLMFKDFMPGDAVLRIRTDIEHKNPAMRDWPAFRIKETEHPHVGKKYRVWPLLNFAVAIDDYELKVTHTVRGKDHMDNEKRQMYIYEYMKWDMPQHLYIGRINFDGFEVSCTKTLQKIKDCKYSGWDDIRLPFMPALRRRGYQPEAFIKYAIEVGITQNDKTVSMQEYFKTINAFNKEVVDDIANRYFIIRKPVKIKIENAPVLDVELNIHPSHDERGKRLFKTNTDFYIEEYDKDAFKNNTIIRLMDCLNFIVKNGKFVFDSLEYEQYKKKGERIIHWLPVSNELADVEILMPDNTTVSGLGEPLMKKLKVGDIIQAERFGFMRLDEIIRVNNKEKLIFWFTHN